MKYIATIMRTPGQDLELVRGLHNLRPRHRARRRERGRIVAALLHDHRIEQTDRQTCLAGDAVNQRENHTAAFLGEPTKTEARPIGENCTIVRT